MREIKFRYWDKERREMVYIGGEMHITFNPTGLGENIPYYVVPATNEIMQYTGLKDKNGKEIYEGDVLKALNGHLFELVWYDGLACFNARSIRCHDEMMSVGWPLAEVIGNIYENPELVS